MATSEECSRATQVLLVNSQSLPVLLQSETEEGPNDISVDLLQQALQRAAAIDDTEDAPASAEVSLDTINGNNNGVVAIFQAEGGRTQTLKISLAQAESLGLNFASDSYPVSATLGNMKDDVCRDQLMTGNVSSSQVLSLEDSNFLPSITNLVTEGRMIDEEGNIVQAGGGLQVLPDAPLSTLGMNPSITIIPQYGLDGSVTYAVKLKDQDGNVLGPDYRLMEPDSSVKTGMDIEDEMAQASLKQNLLQAPVSISLPTSVSLAVPQSMCTSTPIALPMTTFESLTKQISLPIATPQAISTSVPISVERPVTLSLSSAIPTANSITSRTLNKFEAPTPTASMNLSSPVQNQFFRLIPDRNTLNLGGGNTASSTSTLANVTNIISQPMAGMNRQRSSKNNSGSVQQTQISAALMQPAHFNINTNSLLVGNQSCPSIMTTINPTRSGATRLRSSAAASRPSSMLTTSSRNMPISATKVMPVSVATPTAGIVTNAPAPAMGAVAPISTQPAIGGASTSKANPLPNSRPPTTNSKSAKPLGSSENPIQLVQQGQTFHSMQALSQSQLRQIATVLQQKHLNTNSVTKNVLFDEQTKTRIVYRVVYPEDVDLQQPSSPLEGKDTASGNNELDSSVTGKAKRKPGRPTRKSRVKDVDFEEEEDHSAEEAQAKIERKKLIGSRTRSGRVSRPPKHMMKDFKRLHHLDYQQQEVDDSDGGYSDYHTPENVEKPVDGSDSQVKGSSPVKKRVSRYSCPTCNKMYLGQGKLDRHFELYPDHVSTEEFKQSVSVQPLSVGESSQGAESDKKARNGGVKPIVSRGKRKGQLTYRSDEDRSNWRKKKLKQAVEACEVKEVMEVVGPLLARYYSLWDLLLLRLDARDKSQKQGDEEVSGVQAVPTSKCEDANSKLTGNRAETSQMLRANTNKVQWLLMELNSLADTLQSMAGDLLQPASMQHDMSNHVEINGKTLSELFGVNCGTYRINDQPLHKQLDVLTSGNKHLVDGSPDIECAKRMRKELDVSIDNSSGNTGTDSQSCPEVLSTLSLMAKPSVHSENDKSILSMKLTDDMPFLNSSDDMICDGEDHDLSTDSKRDQDCDSAAGLQVVDELVNERLKNLGENINFSVPLQNELQTHNLSSEQTNFIGSFSNGDAALSVNNSAVITNSMDSSKPSASVSNMDLISTYSISSVPITQSVTNPVSSSDLTNALEPVSNQGMLGSFSIGLPSLGSFDSIQTQPSSNVSHPSDSFLDTLSSFETPLTQSCVSTEVRVSSFGNSVMKNSAVLQLASEPPDQNRPPPKFISSFTPADTSDKPSTPISTAQRLQRSYLELDGGLDVGLDTDIDFEALTEEFNRNTQD